MRPRGSLAAACSMTMAILALTGCGSQIDTVPSGDGGAGGFAGDGGSGGSGGSSTESCGGGTCPSHMTCASVDGKPWCLPDADADGVPDEEDNCPYDASSDQADADQDGIGDGCDLCAGPDASASCTDADGDGVSDASDNCRYLANPSQTDTDADTLGDACDLCLAPYDPLSPCGDPCLDSDGDGVPDLGDCGSEPNDNCPLAPSKGDDLDGDGVGNVCDPDGIPPMQQGGASRAPTRAERRLQQRLAMLRRRVELGILDRATAKIALEGLCAG